MDKKNTPQKPELIEPSSSLPTIENPNVLVYNFLKENKLRIKASAVEPDGGFIGDGFLLEDKPLLKIVFERI